MSTACTAHKCYWPECEQIGCTKPLQEVLAERGELLAMLRGWLEVYPRGQIAEETRALIARIGGGK